MKSKDPVQEAVKAITQLGGWAYRDPSMKYVWIIVCPAILGRMSYGCSTNQSLIDWANLHSEVQYA